MSETLNQSDSVDFGKQVLQSELPVLVDYWANGAHRAKRWRRCWMKSRRNTATGYAS